LVGKIGGYLIRFTSTPAGVTRVATFTPAARAAWYANPGEVFPSAKNPCPTAKSAIGYFDFRTLRGVNWKSSLILNVMV